jgi:Arc/MetJ family transcription regulator
MVQLIIINKGVTHMRAYHAQQTEQLHIQEPSTETSQAAVPEKQRRTYYAYACDDQAVAAIREKYALSTDSDAVRLALRLVAQADGLQIRLAPVAAKRIVIKLKRPAS